LLLFKEFLLVIKSWSFMSSVLVPFARKFHDQIRNVVPVL
jgi:hypothetical protein